VVTTNFYKMNVCT